MSWKAVAAGILAVFLFAAGVLTGAAILISSQASSRHSQAFKTSIRLHKASSRVEHDHGKLLRAQGLSRLAPARDEVASFHNGIAVTSAASDTSAVPLPAAASGASRCCLSRSSQTSQCPTISASGTHPRGSVAAAVQWDRWHLVLCGTVSGSLPVEGPHAAQAGKAHCFFKCCKCGSLSS